MKQKMRFGGFCVLFLVAAVFALSGGVGMIAHAADNGSECAKQINKSIAPEAQLEEAKLYLQNVGRCENASFQGGTQKCERQTPAIPGQHFSGQRQGRGRSHSQKDQKRSGPAWQNRYVCLSGQESARSTRIH